MIIATTHAQGYMPDHLFYFIFNNTRCPSPGCHLLYSYPVASRRGASKAL